MKLPFLRVDGTDIVDDRGKSVALRGVALGGWLMMEGYMLCGRNIPEKVFKRNLAKFSGEGAVDDFSRSFRGAFVTENDIKTIKHWGASCIRIPFNYRILEGAGIVDLDRVVGWCAKHSLYCILDMHAAPGAQNEDWHSDCEGQPQLFLKRSNREKYIRLWQFIARRYRDESAVAGYDILNEPVVPFTKERIVRDLYERATEMIRSVDSRHIIFQEGNFWAQRLKVLGKPSDDNTAFSIHMYPPSEFTFNWDVDLEYPCRVAGVKWDKNRLESLVKEYSLIGKRVNVPIYVGEFGVNWRGGYFGELDWTEDIVSLFKKYGFHWTYWTYKTVANSEFPDGIYRYIKNSPWVNRKGPVTGWENFYTMWKKYRRDIVRSWDTENFVLNKKLLSVLRKWM